MPTNRFSGTGYRVLIRTAGSSCDTLCRSTFVPGATELDRRRLRLLLIQPRRLIPLRTGLELFAVCTNVCEAGTRQAQQLRRSGKSSGNKWQLGYQLEHQEQGHQLRRPEKHSLSSKPFSLASGRYEKAFKLFELATKKGSMRALFFNERSTDGTTDTTTPPESDVVSVGTDSAGKGLQSKSAPQSEDEWPRAR
jgi:hypothetical protein